jgi:hypothetical protein
LLPRLTLGFARFHRAGARNQLIYVGLQAVMSFKPISIESGAYDRGHSIPLGSRRSPFWRDRVCRSCPACLCSGHDWPRHNFGIQTRACEARSTYRASVRARGRGAVERVGHEGFLPYLGGSRRGAGDRSAGVRFGAEGVAPIGRRATSSHRGEGVVVPEMSTPRRLRLDFVRGSSPGIAQHRLPPAAR